MTRRGQLKAENNRLVFRGSRGEYWLTRVVFLKCLGFIYLVAFAIALNANGGLLGEDGLLPATRYMAMLQKKKFPQLSQFERMLQVPTLFWFLPATEDNLWYVAAIGVGVSAFLTWRGAANTPTMFLLWALYQSIVNVGQTWYSFGWESQLLETGFLAMFLVPWFSLSRFPRHSPPPWVCVWGYRWLLFRVMLGAGLIKVRGDQCWRDLTCTDYHYQTQPNPNPLSLYMHHVLPPIWHKGDVVINHIVELVIPWGLLLTRPIRCWSGSIQLAFQAALVLSGNLSFLNWLTALAAIFSFDDAHLGWLFSAASCRRARLATSSPSSPAAAAYALETASHRDGQTRVRSRPNGSDRDGNEVVSGSVVANGGGISNSSDGDDGDDSNDDDGVAVNGSSNTTRGHHSTRVAIHERGVDTCTTTASTAAATAGRVATAFSVAIADDGDDGDEEEELSPDRSLGFSRAALHENKEETGETPTAESRRTAGQVGAEDVSGPSTSSGRPRIQDCPRPRRCRGGEEGRADGPGVVGRTLRWSVNATMLVLVVKLSVPVVKNMVMPERGQQLMNTSFDRFRIVNTYGAFGSITKQRYEIILKGTRHDNPLDPAAEWREYEFKCKPGGLSRRPCIISPFHYRLDWQMWFAAFQNYQNNPWIVNLAAKLLSRDHTTRVRVGSLLETDPFLGEEENKDIDDAGERGGGEPPRFIKADLYLYEFAKPPKTTVENQECAAAITGDVCHTVKSDSISNENVHSIVEHGSWWMRTYTREYMPAIALDNKSMHQFLLAHHLE